VTIVVDALVIACGVVVGRVIGRVIRSRREKGAAAGAPAATSTAVAPAPPRDLLESFPCKLGDVVVRRAERDEAWLAGALVFSEDSPRAALFVAPEAGTDRALFVRELAGAPLVWLAPLPANALGFTGEPPHVVEHESTRFERVRRLPVRVDRLGTGTPVVGSTAVIAEYEGRGSERMVVVAGGEATLAWRGVALAEDEYDLLPGGKSTLGESA
jgi:hypothetical protein